MFKRQLLILFILLFCRFVKLYAGVKPTERRQLEIEKTVVPVKIDGELTDEVWLKSNKASNFFQTFPFDSSFAISQTEAMVSYDDNFLYVAAICYDSLPGDYIVSSLKRDWSYPLNDAFAVSLDPFNDKSNGFSFGVNAVGAQREGLITNGGTMGVTTDWDNKWYSVVKQFQNKWIVEMAIPFTSLRFKEGISTWGINFSRNDLKRNENSVWCRVPRQFNISTLGYVGELVWDAPPKKTGTNIALIPYGIVNVSEDFVNKTSQLKPNMGLDAKIAVTSSLNLDLTLNSDFSQAEVDRQQTNLTRFSLFFPERRNFFIENSDLFARYGFSTIRPFFSRQIGLKNGLVIPIIGGARLSGKINQNWRIGLMNIQTSNFKNKSDTILPENYTVAAVQRQLFTKCNIAFIFVNRQGFESENSISSANYNRVVGVDYNHISRNNKLQGKTFLHYSLEPNAASNNYSHAVWADYNGNNFRCDYNHEIVGDNFIADVGFVPRLNQYNPKTNEFVRIGFIRHEDFANYSFYPKSKIVNNHGPRFYYNQYSSLKFLPNDENIQIGYFLNFQNQSTLNIKAQKLFTRLFFNTDLAQNGSVILAPGTYNYNNIIVEYFSSRIKKLNGTLNVDYGTFYTGNKLSVFGEINYRTQPYGTLTIAYNLDQLIFGNPTKPLTLHLIGPKAEMAFTKNLFFTTFLQYNTQISNFNINARIQWRFKPMSDLYLVYSDNYNNYLGIKNRALVVKFVYWLNFKA